MSKETQEGTSPQRNAGAIVAFAALMWALVLGAVAFLLMRRRRDVAAKAGTVAAKTAARSAAETAAKTAARTAARPARRPMRTPRVMGRAGKPARRMLLTLAIYALEHNLPRRAIILGLKLARSQS